MAWQLIYTSAPRLLEAGRTGFGTVARHRAVSGMLAAAVERFSQFARLPGHDPRRVVHTCRILTVGSSTYHVLSCLQDAGSDYTGRTNHIAHHLIAEPREIRSLAAAGLTPADVLMGMAWRTSWSEGPRYLDSAEEIDLSSFASRPSHAWSAITGNPASATLLWSREALKGCYLITPPGANVLELFRESLFASPQQAWQTRFTTCLEPNDDVADFRWVALTSSSPLRSQVETSNRLVLDLTRPSSLPPPPEVEAPAPAFEAPASAAPPLPPPQLSASVPPRSHSSGTIPPPAATMGGWSPETRQKSPKGSRSYIGISLAIAAVLIIGVGGGLFWQFQKQQQQNQARTSYETSIAKVWKDNGLLLDDTRKFLENQPVLEDGKTLLKSHEEFFRGMKQVLNHPGTSSPALPTDTKDDLNKLKELLDEWIALHRNPWQKLQGEKDTATAASLYQALRTWENSRNAAWKKLTEFLDLKSPTPPQDELLQPLKAIAKAALTREEPAPETRTAWSDLFELFDHQKSPMDAESQRWLKLWADLDSSSPRAAAEKNFADNTLPAWLRKKAENVKQQQDKARAGQMAEQNKTDPASQTKEPPKPKVVLEDADAIPSKHDIHVLLLKPGEDPAGKVSGLKVAADMQLFVGGAWEAHPAPEGKSEPKDGELKQLVSISVDGNNDINFGPSKLAQLHDMVRISSTGSLLALPEQFRSPANGLRLVGRSKDAVNVLFDLRLIPAGSVVAKPIFAKDIPAIADNFSTATLRLPEGFIPKFKLQGATNLVYSLRLDGALADQKTFELKPTVDSSFEVIPPAAKTGLGLSLQDIRQQIADLEKGIVKDDADIAALENIKLSPREKDLRRENYNKGRSEKEIKLQALRAQLQSLEGQQTVHFDLMPGRYTLLIEQPNTKIELCRLNVTPATKTPTSKPSNP
jgi:DNA-binding transcriptional MerR regulator